MEFTLFLQYLNIRGLVGASVDNDVSLFEPFFTFKSDEFGVAGTCTDENNFVHYLSPFFFQ